MNAMQVVVDNPHACTESVQALHTHLCNTLLHTSRYQMLMMHHCVGALKAYKKSLELHREQPTTNGHAEGAAPEAGQVPARLLNNAAIVHFMCNKAKEALDLLVEASQVSQIAVSDSTQ